MSSPDAFDERFCAGATNVLADAWSTVASIGNGAVAVSATRGRSECGLPLCVQARAMGRLAAALGVTLEARASTTD